MFKKTFSSLNSFVNNNVVESLQNFSKVTVLSVLALGAVSLSSCKKDFSNGSDSFGNRSTAAADYAASSLPVVTVSGDITTAVSWSASNVYEISGVVTVRGGGSLTIAPGTFIKSTVNTTGANGVLVIAKDGTINAVGTANAPIVFTSRYLLDGNDATVGAPGHFGGLIVLGDAPVNTASGTSNIEGLPTDNANFSFGGSDETDNRGSIRFVRIEYAGYQLAPNIEVNGLTLGGVGSGTTINNVEVAWGLDDGFEFFGGTVSTSDLIAFSNDDDQFDYDLGYNGTLSNSIAIANKTSTHSGVVSPANSDSNGAEIDNNPTTFTAVPTTHPIFENVRIYGTRDLLNITVPGFKNGITVRRGAELEFIDSKVTGYTIGLRIDANATAANTLVGSSSLHGFTAPFDPSTGTAPALVPLFTDLGGNTYTYNSSTAPTFGSSPFQPFFNEASFNPGLSYAWAKFNY